MGPMAIAASIGHRGRLGNISENVPERKALEKVNGNMHAWKICIFSSVAWISLDFIMIIIFLSFCPPCFIILRLGIFSLFFMFSSIFAHGG